MDHDPRCCARTDPTAGEPGTDAGPVDPTDPATPCEATAGIDDPVTAEQVGNIDWIAVQTELDRCDGYVVLAVDPQTGEVDAHGPYPGLDALQTADGLRQTLDREGLHDVVVRVVRWHQQRGGDTAA
ncbi:hypothetical protein [Actinomycetospora lemnae]|uniref:Uncharacterized protein n=1 Tax=Actinomycetospora lemnae TaxID=3019891 RepID=A0ABT5SVS0_9PSEU|nr:hypothetical protein [Actinomycetospora sp. DW7H6]MDD7966874.1 hypothetical protein [Actinomycetospora sp. DW7H6]